jgi:sec-independent protein translocase protein TatA
MGMLALANVGPWEVIVILVVALLLFGKRLPEVARSAGKAVSEFKKGMREGEEQLNEVAKIDVAKKETKAEEPGKAQEKSEKDSAGPKWNN